MSLIKLIPLLVSLGATHSGAIKAEDGLFSAASDKLLADCLYKHPERLVSHIAPSGAVGINGEYEQGRSSKWFIEQQRYGADLVQAGLEQSETGLVARGWHLLDWGFDKQGASGDFPGTGDPFHSASFFVEASARALLLTKQAGGSAEKDRLLRLKHAANWLATPKEEVIGKRRNLPYTHRRWILAAALGETAALTGDIRLFKIAESYAIDGLSLQTEDGINPEKGGGDSNYQAVGVLFAARYYYVCRDSNLQSRISHMIERAMNWESSVVDAHGDVSTQGSTRVGNEVDRLGNAKKVDYKAIVQAFVLASKITGHHDFADVAEKICRGRRWL